MGLTPNKIFTRCRVMVIKAGCGLMRGCDLVWPNEGFGRFDPAFCMSILGVCRISE